MSEIWGCLNISDRRYGLIHLASSSFFKHMAVLSHNFLASFFNLFLYLVQILKVDLVLVFQVVVREFQNSIEWNDLIWRLLCPTGIFSLEKWTTSSLPSSVYFLSDLLDHFVPSFLKKLFFTYHHALFSSGNWCGYALLTTYRVQTRASFLIIMVPRYASSLHICLCLLTYLSVSLIENNLFTIENKIK